MMKQIFKYTLSLVTATLALVSCSDYQAIEYPAVGTDHPSSITNVETSPLPGKIALKWDVPADSNYYFVKVSYFDHLTQKNIARVASVYKDTMEIPGTRAKFGEYEFKIQTFSRANIGGEIATVRGVSGIAPAIVTITKTKIPLTAGQLSTNAQEPTEGPIANLIDGNANTFFHTRWSSPQIDMPQYIQVNLNEPHQNFQFYYQNRNGSQVGAEILEVQISNDGQTWETLTKISSGLPSASKAEYTSEIFQPAHSFTYFRYNVLQTYGSKKYFNMAEFALYNVVINTYDPEL